MMTLLKKVSTFWFIVLPIAVAIVILFAILTRFVESNATRITGREIDRSLTEVARDVETTIRTLMINNPRKVKGFYRLLDSLRGERKVLDDLNGMRQKRLNQMENALRLIDEEEDFQIADANVIRQLHNKYGSRLVDVRLLPTQPDIRATIIPAPVVREEMLQDVLDIHPERYPLPDEIETLVIATARQFRGNVQVGEKSYLRVTSPILAGAVCMNCHLSAIEGQPMAAITVQADLKKPRIAIATLTKRVFVFGALIILIILLIVLLVSRYLGTTLDRLSRQAMRFGYGDYETEIGAQGVREIVSLASSFEGARIRIHDFIHDILKSIPSLLFIIDKEGKASSNYSQPVQDFFGEIEGKDVNRVIFKPQGKDLTSVLEMVFEAGATMSFEDLIALAPSEIEIEDKVIKLIYHPIYQKKTLLKILVIGENITALRQSEEARAAEQKQNEMILEIVKNPIGFQEFYEESQSLIEAGQMLMKRDDGLLTDAELVEIQRILHTIKGAAGIFQIQELVSIAHGNEDELYELKTSNQAIGRKTIYPILSTLIDELEKANEIYLKYFGERTEEDVLTITTQEAQQLVDLHPDLQAEIDAWAQRLQLGFIRRKADGLVQTTADKLSKEVKLEVDGEEGRISDQTAETISLSLTHLLRNAVGHGIEDPMIREAVGKWPQGNIHIRLKNKGKNIQINIKDDGKGIHPEDLVNSAIDKGLLKPGTKLTPQKALNLIFNSGFSTAGEISSVSGRGVGLDAVKNAINKNKGLITVRSEAGVGTEFIIIMHRNP